MGTLGRKAGGADYERFRAALALKESSGNPSAVQWDTKAHGLFQFIPRWHADWIKEETGRELGSFMPKDNSKEEMERSAKEQTEILFPKYYERELAPFIERARKAGIAGSYTDDELAAMAHFAGSGGAEKFLRTGADNTLGTAGNAAGGIPEYVRQFKKNYNNSPEAVFKQRLETSQHYGEYGLGRGVYENYLDKDIAKSNLTARNKAVRALYKASPPPTFSKEELAANELDKKKDLILPEVLISPEEDSFQEVTSLALSTEPQPTTSKSWRVGTALTALWGRFRTKIKSWIA